MAADVLTVASRPDRTRSPAALSAEVDVQDFSDPGSGKVIYSPPANLVELVSAGFTVATLERLPGIAKGLNGIVRYLGVSMILFYHTSGRHIAGISHA